MSKCHYTSKEDNLLESIMEVRVLVSRIQANREILKADCKRLNQVMENIKFLVENIHKEQNKLFQEEHHG